MSACKYVCNGVFSHRIAMSSNRPFTARPGATPPTRTAPLQPVPHPRAGIIKSRDEGVPEGGTTTTTVTPAPSTTVVTAPVVPTKIVARPTTGGVAEPTFVSLSLIEPAPLIYAMTDRDQTLLKHLKFEFDSEHLSEPGLLDRVLLRAFDLRLSPALAIKGETYEAQKNDVIRVVQFYCHDRGALVRMGEAKVVFTDEQKLVSVAHQLSELERKADLFRDVAQHKIGQSLAHSGKKKNHSSSWSLCGQPQ